MASGPSRLPLAGGQHRVDRVVWPCALEALRLEEMSLFHEARFFEDADRCCVARINRRNDAVSGEIVEGVVDQTAYRFLGVTLVPMLPSYGVPDLRQPIVGLECLEAAIANELSI